MKVLFVCVENSCRSQMAEGFARRFGEGIIEPYSAGSRPSGKVNAMAIEVMEESGIDISSQRSKGFDAFNDTRFEIVITLGCGDICPSMPAQKHIEWNIEDPKGKTIGSFRIVRDMIEGHVKRLLESISDDQR